MSWFNYFVFGLGVIGSVPMIASIGCLPSAAIWTGIMISGAGLLREIGREHRESWISPAGERFTRMHALPPGQPEPPAPNPS